MQLYGSKTIWALLATASIVGGLSLAYAQQEQRGATSYLPVDIKESFASIMARMKAAKPDIEKEHANLLSARYDLSNRPAKDAAMSRRKPLQEGVRVKLPAGATWDQLASMSPAGIRDKNLFPKGFYPLPHPNHPEGGMVFPSLKSTRW
jgi:cytochrome c peroxidase